MPEQHWFANPAVGKGFAVSFWIKTEDDQKEEDSVRVRQATHSGDACVPLHATAYQLKSR